MRRSIVYSFLAALFLSVFPTWTPPLQAAGKLQEITSRGLLLCGVMDSAPPFGYRDESSNTLEGFEVDLCRAVAKKLDVRLDLVPITAADRVPLLLQGAVDLVAASMTHSYELDSFIDFSLTYFMDGQKIMAPAKAGIDGIEGLKDKRVAAVTDSRSADNMTRLQPEAMVLTFDTAPQAFMAMKQGAADAMTADSMTLLGLRHADENPEDWAISETPLSREPYAMGMGENDSDFRDAVNQALAELWTSGEYDKIHEKWFGPQSPYHAPLEWSMTVWP